MKPSAGGQSEDVGDSIRGTVFSAGAQLYLYHMQSHSPTILIVSRQFKFYFAQMKSCDYKSRSFVQQELIELFYETIISENSTSSKQNSPKGDACKLPQVGRAGQVELSYAYHEKDLIFASIWYEWQCKVMDEILLS